MHVLSSVFLVSTLTRREEDEDDLATSLLFWHASMPCGPDVQLRTLKICQGVAHMCHDFGDRRVDYLDTDVARLAFHVERESDVLVALGFPASSSTTEMEAAMEHVVFCFRLFNYSFAAQRAAFPDMQGFQSTMALIAERQLLPLVLSMRERRPHSTFPVSVAPQLGPQHGQLVAASWQLARRVRALYSGVRPPIAVLGCVVLCNDTLVHSDVPPRYVQCLLAVLRMTPSDHVETISICHCEGLGTADADSVAGGAAGAGASSSKLGAGAAGTRAADAQVHASDATAASVRGVEDTPVQRVHSLASASMLLGQQSAQSYGASHAGAGDAFAATGRTSARNSLAAGFEESSVYSKGALLPASSAGSASGVVTAGALPTAGYVALICYERVRLAVIAGVDAGSSFAERLRAHIASRLADLNQRSADVAGGEAGAASSYSSGVGVSPMSGGVGGAAAGAGGGGGASASGAGGGLGVPGSNAGGGLGSGSGGSGLVGNWTSVLGATAPPASQGRAAVLYDAVQGRLLGDIDFEPVVQAAAEAHDYFRTNDGSEALSYVTIDGVFVHARRQGHLEVCVRIAGAEGKSLADLEQEARAIVTQRLNRTLWLS